MAIDHRIIQQIGVGNNKPVLDVFQNALTSQQNREIAQAQEQRRAELNPILMQQQQQALQAAEMQNQQARQGQILKSVNDFAVQNSEMIERVRSGGDPVELQKALVARREQLKQQGLPTETTDQGIVMLGQGNVQAVIEELDGARALYNQQLGQGANAGQREFENLTALAQGDPESLETKAARIKLGLDPRAGISAQERIATDEKLGDQVVQQVTDEAEGAETGKQKSQLKFKPQITKAVKLAEAAAKERGETITELERMEASLPGIKEAVGELLELSDMATSTIGGRAFDFLVKESGFGSTKGADARAKLIAIVDNQVLPLLKETFGAAFTVQEGENLKASLVDPNASPSQKRQQLDAFLAQKERNIRTKQTQLGESQNVELPPGGVPAEQPQVIKFDAQGNIIQ